MKTLAFRVLYLRAILVYWALVAVGFLAAGALGGRGSGSLAADLVWLMVVAAAGSALIFGLAGAIRSSTTYALTDRRVVIRMGVAFPSVLNLPLHQIDAVDVRATGKDREGREVGDLVLTPIGGEQVGWLYLWPHVKPWSWRTPAPALRAIPEAAYVGNLVARHAKARLDQLQGEREDTA